MPTVRDIRAKAGKEPITMLTAYDAPTAAVVDEAGVDMILVGDSMGNTALGYDSTLPVTVDEIASRTGAVVRGTEDALVVADLPFLGFGYDEKSAVENAGRMLKEEGANAVKIESGPHTVELTETLSNLGIPVMAHLGLTPQKVNQLGHLRQGTSREDADEILDTRTGTRGGGGVFARPRTHPGEPRGDGHGRTRHPDHRHRRGTAHRRTGPRHQRCGRVGRLESALLEAVRRRARRDEAGGVGFPRRGRVRRVPGRGTQPRRRGVGRRLLRRMAAIFGSYRRSARNSTSASLNASGVSSMAR